MTVTLEPGAGVLLEGRPRTVLDVLGGSGDTQKVAWLVHGKEGSQIIIKAESFSAGRDEQTVTLNGGNN